MQPLMLAQHMAAAVFFTVALMHLLVWSRHLNAKVHLLFAITALIASGFILAESWFYRASTLEDFNRAFRWCNHFGAAWAIALIWFVVYYTGADKIRRWLPVSVSALFAIALLINIFAPYGFLYSEITGLREITLPWGERIVLAQGNNSPWRFILDLAQIGMLAIVIDCSIRFWRRGEKQRAGIFGASLVLFIVLFGAHGMLVDLGRLDSPYLSYYGFLLITLVVSYDLAGEVVRASVLSAEVAANERRWRSLMDNIQLLVVGLDKQGRIDYANPFCQKVTGYTSAEICRQPFEHLLPTSEQPRLREAFRQALTGSVQPHFEAMLRTKTGAERSIIWSNVLLHSAKSEIVGALSIGADVTEKHQVEAARDQALEEIKSLKNRLQDQVVYLQDEIKSTHNFERIIGDSDALRYVLHKIEQVAPLDTAVLIEGETGVGKELVARAIHDLSPRHEQPLVKINCATLPPNLIEAELFGHEKGAFTGADQARKGRFELADGGTLFLDEIGELPSELQPKLLHVLQEGEMERLGSDRSISVNVRIIAATNRKLLEAVEQGLFREDLYYRLHVYPITVPPLRQRKEDIPRLVSAFVKNQARVQGKQIEQIPQRIIEQLQQYDWPGNIRELHNVVERAVIATSDNELRLAEALADQRAVPPVSNDDAAIDSNHQATLAEVEKNYIEQVLQHCHWRVDGDKGAAKILGLNPSTLRSRMRKLDITRPQAAILKSTPNSSLDYH